MFSNTLLWVASGVAASGVLVLTGCGDKSPEGSPSATETIEKVVTQVVGARVEKSAVPNPFAQVAPHLDLGGEFYFYLSTQQALKGFTQRFNAALKEMDAMEVEGSTPELKAEAAKIGERVSGVISRSGLEALGAVGFSSLQIEQDLLRVKGILYRDGGSDSIFWNLFGSKPHALPVLDYAPATSGYVISNDFRLGALYKHVREELVKLDIEEAVTGLQEFEKEFAQNMQVPLEKVLDSLDDEWTIILTLDESKMVESPMGTGDQIPEPGLVIMIKTKDNLVFDKITELSGETPVAGEGFKSIALPLPPLTEFLSPFVAQTDSGYLVIASQPSALASVLAAAAGKVPRLKDKESFKKVAKDMPKEGNSFSYTSGAFLKLVTNIQSTIGGATSEMNPYLQEAMTTAQKLNGQGDAVSFASSTEQGYIWIAQAISPAADTPEGGPAVMARLMASLLYGGVIEAASSTGDADDSEDAEATGTGAESTDVTE